MGLLAIQDAKCTEMLEGKPRFLSCSFREVLSKQLSPKLLRKIRETEKAQEIYEKIYLCAGKYSGYEVYRNGISALPFRIETKQSGTWVGECFVIWKSMFGKEIFAPWDEVNEGDIECGMLIDRKNTEALNRALCFNEAEESIAPVFGVDMAVYGRAITGINRLLVGVDEQVSPAMLLEMAYLCESFSRAHQGALSTEGWPRQKGDFEITLCILLGKGQTKVFGAFLQTLENASFPLKYVKCNIKDIFRQI